MRKKIFESGVLTFLILAFIVRLFPYSYYPVVSENSPKPPACCCNNSCCSMGKDCCCNSMQMKNQTAQDSGVPCYRGMDCGNNTDVAVSGYSLYHVIFPTASNLLSPLPYQSLALSSFHKANSYISDLITPPPEA